MNDDFSVNFDRISGYAEKLKKDGLNGVFIGGTTGEGMLMTTEERQKLTEEWIPHQTEDFKVIVHVGAPSSRQAWELACHAERNGAFAVGCMGPVFLTPAGMNELVEFCSEVAGGAPELPFYYYHIPSVSGVDFHMYEFIRQAKNRIPNLAGIKYADNNLMDMRQCLELENGRWDILHGYDEILLAGLALGVTGAVGSTYNYMASLYHGMISDFEQGNLAAARKKQDLSIRMVGILNKYGGAVPAGKALMKSAGVDCGPCRLPVKNVGDSYGQLLQEMENEGVLNPVI